MIAAPILLLGLILVPMISFGILYAIRENSSSRKFQEFFCGIGWHSRKKDRSKLPGRNGIAREKCGWCDHEGNINKFGDLC